MLNTTSNDTLPLRSAPADVRVRSGQAARLAGVPVATLRVWERRYGAVDAPKTPTGQRLYASQDVQRLRLLKQLTSRGHAIGTIASLDLDALQALATDEAPAAPSARRVVVVGKTAAPRLSKFPACAVQAHYDDLDQAEAASPAPDAEVWVVQLPTLQPATAQRVLALAENGQTPALVVLYSFGTEATAESLRAAGATVRREPVSGHELARLVTGASVATAAAPTPMAAHPQPRRFSDESLAELVELPSSVACECPRHMAEIVLQLVGFERYSAECLSRNPEDEALHQHLAEVAGAARTLFENALDRVVAQEGLRR